MGAREEFWRALKNLTERQNQTEKEILELKNTVKELSKNIGGLNRSFGKIPEALSEPEVEERFTEVGFEVFGVSPNLERKYNGRKKEIDLLIHARHNGKNYIIVVETQVQFRSIKEIDENINFWKNEFRKFFPEYKDLPIIGCVCALKFGKGVDKYAVKQGLYCFKPIKGIMGIVNPKDFKFRVL